MFDQNDSIYDSLIKLPQYLMAPSKRILLSHMFRRMQNGVKLTMGPLNELNYEMATSVRNFKRLLLNCKLINFNYIILAIKRHL